MTNLSDLSRYLCGGVVLAWLCSACLNPLDGDTGSITLAPQEATYAVPLLASKVTLTDLMGEDVAGVSLAADADGTLRFRYEGELAAVGSDVVFGRLEEVAAGIFLPIVRNRTAAPFALPNDVDLDILRVKSGRLNYRLTNSYDRPVSVRLSLPEARRDGVPLVITGQLPAYSGSGPLPSLSNPDLPVSLAGYTLNTLQDSLFIRYEVTDDQGNALPPATGTVLTIADLGFDYVEGYLGQTRYPGLRDTVAIGFFANAQGGDIRFAAPAITMTIDNSFGVPALALISTLNVVQANGDTLAVTGPGVAEGFAFNFPRRPGPAARTTFTFDTTNSNLADLLSARPVALDYEIDALLHPTGDTTIRGFLTDTAAYRARVTFDLPLVGRAHQFALRDTLAVNLMNDYADIAAVTFRLTTKNSLPLGLELTGRFLDADGRRLADLADGALTILRAGTPAAPDVFTRDVTFADDRLTALRSATQLELRLQLSTAGQGVDFVRLTDQQELEVLLGAQITLRRE